MAEDRSLQSLQRLTRLDPEVVDQRAPRFGVRIERVGLSVSTVEGEHLLRAESFPQRMLTHEQV